MYYFLAEDLDALNTQIDELTMKLREIGQEMGDAVGQSSETWHDNFGHEEATRQYGMWSQRLRELVEVRDNAQVVIPSRAPRTVVIASRITFVDGDGVEKTLQIGSFTVPTNKQDVSYISPIARILIGARAGAEVTGKIAGKDVTYEILKVEPYVQS